MGIGDGEIDGGLVRLLDRLRHAALLVDPVRRRVLHGNAGFCALSGFAPGDLPSLDLAQLHDVRDLEWIFQAAGGAETAASRRVSCLGKGETPFLADLGVTRLGGAAATLVLLEYDPPPVETAEKTLADHRLRSSLLTGFTRRLAAAWDRDAVGQVASEAASGLLGAERMLILLRRAGTGGTEVLVSWGLEGEALAAAKHRLDDLLLGGLLPPGRPTVVTVEEPPSLVAAGVRSLAVYGLEWDGRLTAAWALGYLDPEAAAESYLDLGQTFAAHLSGALPGTLLLERTRKEKLHQEVLNRILTSLRGAADLDAVLRSLSAELRRALDADHCAILVSEEMGGEAASLRVEFEDAAGGVPPLGGGGPIAFGGTALGAAILYSKDVLAVEDFAHRPDLTEDHEALVQRLGTRGFIAAKILARGEFLGLVTALTRGKARAWAADEIDLIRAVADHVSITLRTRDLVRANEERSRQLDLLSRVQHAAARVREEDALRSESEISGLPATIARGAAGAIAATYPALGVRITGIEGSTGEIAAGAASGPSAPSICCPAADRSAPAIARPWSSWRTGWA
jgi:GAF domain-containing protein